MHRRQAEEDLDSEVEAYFEIQVERRMAGGLSREAARRAARVEFEGPEEVKERVREARMGAAIETTLRDIRYACRVLRKSPGFTAIVVLMLTLGIGANTAVFTLLDQLVLRLLPVREPERLVMIWPTATNIGSIEGERSVSYPMYQDFQRKAVAFESVFCRYDTPAAVSFGGRTERAYGELVSGNYFQALGVRPVLGRVFSPEADDRIYKGHPVVVLSYVYWRNRFGADPQMVGRKILVNKFPMEVVGVAAPGFAGLDPSRSRDFWAPVLMSPVMTPDERENRMADRHAQWLQVLARLKPGYTVASARASLQPLFHQILEQEASDGTVSKLSRQDRDRYLSRKALVETAATGYSDMRQRYSTSLIVLMAMAALILLIACSNVASLLIARATARQKEIAVRLAVGAGRRALIRQLLAESFLLSLSAAVLGLALSGATTRALLDMLPGGATLMLRAEPDSRILLFSIGVALVTGLTFGLAPAFQGTRLDLAVTLKDLGGATAGNGRSARLRRALVTVQVALSSLLLVGAGLFAKTLINLKNAHTGFENIGHLVAFQVDPESAGYNVQRIGAFYADVLGELRHTPGVQSAAYAVVPVLQGFYSRWRFAVEGHQAKEGDDMLANMNLVSPGYFRTMGLRLVAGRDFDEGDRFTGANAAQMPSVVIVNRKFAERFFGKDGAIGRHIGNGGSGGQSLGMRIVGVVEDSQDEGPRQDAQLQVFWAQAEAPVPVPAFFYVRTSTAPAAMFATLRRIVAKLDPSLPVMDMKTLGAQLDETLSSERLIASLSATFGGLATVLAAFGLYGVMAFVVARRTKEIGLRMALGSPRQLVLWLVLREALLLAACGLAIGIPCAWLLTRWVSAELFGVAPADAWTFATSTAVLGLVAVLAGFAPAQRASMIDPIAALRHE
jgi:predicted permease